MEPHEFFEPSPDDIEEMKYHDRLTLGIDEPRFANKKPYRDSPEGPCPECGGWLILFTGYEMFEEKPIARNFHCEECDTHYSEEYGDGPFE